MLEENLSYAQRGEMAVAYASGIAATSGAVRCLATGRRVNEKRARAEARALSFIIVLVVREPEGSRR
jgi:cystathionine beta-lyase/cystathionine gamma-synthase